MNDLLNETFFRFVVGFVGILLFSFTVLILINIYAPDTSLLKGGADADSKTIQESAQESQ
jgi:hypothetical protein